MYFHLFLSSLPSCPLKYYTFCGKCGDLRDTWAFAFFFENEVKNEKISNLISISAHIHIVAINPAHKFFTVFLRTRCLENPHQSPYRCFVLGHFRYLSIIPMYFHLKRKRKKKKNNPEFILCF